MRPSLAHTAVLSSNNEASNPKKAQLSVLSFAVLVHSTQLKRRAHHIKYAVCRQQVQRSPSPKAKPDLEGATLMIAILELKTAESCRMFVVRMLRDRLTPARSTAALTRAGEAKGSWSALEESFGES